MSNQIELRHVRYFLAVAEDLHFRKAAERLFISQPGLSRQIKQMEVSLGYPLFERTNRKVFLTKAGKYLRQAICQTAHQTTTRPFNKVNIKMEGHGAVIISSIAEPYIIRALAGIAEQCFKKLIRPFWWKYLFQYTV